MKKTKWTLLILSALFIVPYLGAWVFYTTSHQATHKTKNHGELLQATGTLQALNLPTSPKWTLLYIAKTKCASQCVTTLHRMKKIRLVLGKAMSRVDRVLVTPTPVEGKLAIAFQNDLKGTHYFVRPAPLLKNYAGLYIADPNGNIILRYPDKTQANAIYEDLRHLLKASQIG